MPRSRWGNRNEYTPIENTMEPITQRYVPGTPRNSRGGLAESLAMQNMQINPAMLPEVNPRTMPDIMIDDALAQIDTINPAIASTSPMNINRAALDAEYNQTYAPKPKAKTKTKSKAKRKARPSFQQEVNSMIDKEHGKGTAARMDRERVDPLSVLNQPARSATPMYEPRMNDRNAPGASYNRGAYGYNDILDMF